MSESLDQSNPRIEYKDVQVGPDRIAVPVDWETTTMEDVTEKFISGGTPDSDEEAYWGGEIPWTTCAVVEGPIFEGEKDFITEDGLAKSTASLVPAGCILFGTRVNVANVGRTKRDIAISQDLTGIVVDETKINPDYLTWYLLFNQSKIRERYSQGSTIQGMITSDLKSLQILTPPLPEQRRIADILSKADAQVRWTDEIIDETKELKRGILNDLIPRGINEMGELRPNPEDQPDLYKDVQRYKIPTEWKVATLQEICDKDITYGIVQAGPHVDDGVPYIKTGDMTGENLNSDELSRTSEEIACDYDRSKIQQGELVITVRATIGVAKQVPVELDGANLSRGAARISPGDSICNRYLLWALRSSMVQSLMQARTNGSTFDEIKIGTLRKIPIPYPADIAEQRAISDRLDVISETLDVEKAQLSGLKKLKRGLMQDLLTGKVRVKPES